MKIMVYDLGGGTLDVTIMEFGKGVFEVKSTSGDTQLGGTDMDNAIVDFLADEFKNQTEIDVKGNAAGDAEAQGIRGEGKDRAFFCSYDRDKPSFLRPGQAQESRSTSHTRSQGRSLRALLSRLVERSTKPVMQALKDAKLEPSGLDKVVLIGGPTRMPIVQRYVEQLLGKKVERGVDPMEAVALGAAIQAGVLTGEVKDIVLLDVTPLSLSIETMGGVATKLIDRNTTIP